MTIKIVLNRLTVIWPFQPSNLVLYKINLRQQHVFYKIVKLDSKLLIKLDTIPLTYFILLTWTCPPEFETYYQIKDITHTSCSDGNLCPPLWYTSVTQRDEERKKKITKITSVNDLSENILFFTWEAAEKPCGIFEYHSSFKVLVLFEKIKKLQDLYKNIHKFLNFCTNLKPTWEYERYKIRLAINIID